MTQAASRRHRDGVFAIAMTLLVLDIKVPHDLPEGASLAEALLRQWRTYLAFLTSFATIGIMWVFGDTVVVVACMPSDTRDDGSVGRNG